MFQNLVLLLDLPIKLVKLDDCARRPLLDLSFFDIIMAGARNDFGCLITMRPRYLVTLLFVYLQLETGIIILTWARIALNRLVQIAISTLSVE